ncbi:hypothetical protein ACLOJK_031315 [Asimina triloba]
MSGPNPGHNHKVQNKRLTSLSHHFEDVEGNTINCVSHHLHHDDTDAIANIIKDGISRALAQKRIVYIYQGPLDIMDAKKKVLYAPRSFSGVEDFLDEDNSRPYTYEKEKKSKKPPSVTHRVTSKQVAVAGTNSKDIKVVLKSRSTVGRILAERAREADVYTAFYTPREGDKFEGKIRAVVQSLIDNGIDTKFTHAVDKLGYSLAIVSNKLKFLRSGFFFENIRGDDFRVRRGKEVHGRGAQQHSLSQCPLFYVINYSPCLGFLVGSRKRSWS